MPRAVREHRRWLAQYPFTDGRLSHDRTTALLDPGRLVGRLVGHLVRLQKLRKRVEAESGGLDRITAALGELGEHLLTPEARAAKEAAALESLKRRETDLALRLRLHEEAGPPPSRTRLSIAATIFGGLLGVKTRRINGPGYWHYIADAKTLAALRQDLENVRKEIVDAEKRRRREKGDSRT
jgi:hypothetical protein